MHIFSVRQKQYSSMILIYSLNCNFRRCSFSPISSRIPSPENKHPVLFRMSDSLICFLISNLYLIFEMSAYIVFLLRVFYCILLRPRNSRDFIVDGNSAVRRARYLDIDIYKKNSNAQISTGDTAKIKGTNYCRNTTRLNKRNNLEFARTDVLDTQNVLDRQLRKLQI